MKTPLATLLKDPYILAIIIGIAGIVGVLIANLF